MARNGHFEATCVLIEADADLDHTAKYSLSALMLAAINDHLDVVEQLVVSLGGLYISRRAAQMSADQATDCDPSRCPLCGEPNQCATAADPEATECWCESEKFPRDLLERVPENAVRHACICHRCLKDHGKSTAG